MAIGNADEYLMDRIVTKATNFKTILPQKRFTSITVAFQLIDPEIKLVEYHSLSCVHPMPSE